MNHARTVDKRGKSKCPSHGGAELGNRATRGLVRHARADGGQDLSGERNERRENLVNSSGVEVRVEEAKGGGVGHGQGDHGESGTASLMVYRPSGRADLREFGALGGENERVGREEMALGRLARMGVEHAEQVRWNCLERLRTIPDVELEFRGEGCGIDRWED